MLAMRQSSEAVPESSNILANNLGPAVQAAASMATAQSGDIVVILD